MTNESNDNEVVREITIELNDDTIFFYLFQSLPAKLKSPIGKLADQMGKNGFDSPEIMTALAALVSALAAENGKKRHAKREEQDASTRA